MALVAVMARRPLATFMPTGSTKTNSESHTRRIGRVSCQHNASDTLLAGYHLMRNSSLRLIECLVLLFALGGVSSAANVMDKFIPLTVSIPPINLKPHEQVISFSCVVVDGAILKLATPYLWEIHIENGDAGRGRLTADCYLGDFAFGPKDLSYFHDFLVIGKPRSGFAGLASFNVEIQLSIAPEDDFHHPRIVTLEMKQLKFESSNIGCK
jgi:hypothetical protein